MPLYQTDQLKVLKENCEIRVVKENKQTVVRKANSPYIVEKTSPSGLNSISEWFSRLWKKQKSRRVSSERTPK
jgi:hypothetical protein